MNKPLLLTILGGTGDLTLRKLLPALYNLDVSGALKPEVQILIIGRRDYTDEEYRTQIRKWVEQFARLPFTDSHFQTFAKKLSYFKMDFSTPQAFDSLGEYFRTIGERDYLFYYAVAPRFFSVITEGIGRIEGTHSGKAVLEKPFGENLADAKALNEQLEKTFLPEHVYRIDHYLGKEMIRGISAIRFTNPIFNYSWDARQIEYIEISALEKIGVETRGGYYENAGALQDMVQNHLFQVLTILAMEHPSQFYGEQLHAEQLKVLRALRPPSADKIRQNLILGQYEGYCTEPGINSDSRTETFAALRVFIDNDRWRNMPFYIRTGKKAGERETKVTVAFRRMSPDLPRNLLTILIQPTEGVHLQFNMKKPGETDDIIEAKMDFCQNNSAGSQGNTPEAYERLLAACVHDERYWFSQWDQIEAGWTYVADLKELAQKQQLDVLTYPQGQAGPNEALLLPEKFGHSWHP